MSFKFEKVIDGQRIEVSPKWSINTDENTKITGNELTIIGYKIPENSDIHSNYAISKLNILLKNKELILKNPKILSTDPAKIACSVFVDNIDVSNYFPEYKTI